MTKKPKYYNSNNMSMEGFTSNGWWFTGGTSFMSNGYVIYRDGLGGYDPNPFAIKQGNSYNSRLFDSRSMDKRSSYYKFTKQLSEIANRAAASEKRFLELKLAQLRHNNSEFQIQDSWLNKIEEAIKRENYGAAYTLLLKRTKNLQEIQRELASKRNKSFQKTNDFWNDQFMNYMIKQIESQLVNQTENIREISFDADFDKLIDDYFHTLNLDVNSNASLKSLKESYVHDLENSVVKDGIRLKFRQNKGDKQIKQIVGTKQIEIPLKAIKTKKTGNFRRPSTIARYVAEILFKNIGLGLSQEAISISSWQSIGSSPIASGKMRKDTYNLLGELSGKAVQQRADSIVMDVFGIDIDINTIVQEVYQKQLIESGKQIYGQDFISEVERQILKAIEGTDAAEFFEIEENIKGYRSNFDLAIAREGNFNNRMADLKQLHLDGNMVNKLIFMLNNTTQNCIMDNRIDEIADYLASVCVVWMWDSTSDFFDESTVPAHVNKIHLFNSGGAYFTASQIIRSTLQRLVQYGEDNNEFVQITINPPTPYTDNDYTALMNRVTPNPKPKDKEGWMNMLREMWDTVKNEALDSGSLAIHFKQGELDELIGELRAILNN